MDSMSKWVSDVLGVYGVIYRIWSEGIPGLIYVSLIKYSNVINCSICTISV